MASAFRFLEYTEENRTAIIKINRPEVYNALNIEAKMEIIQAIREANKNPQVLSIILTAVGKAFCTGQDLNDRSVQAQNGAIDLGHTLQTEWNPLVNAIRDSKKIVIAAVNGVCAGAGISVAVASDLIVACPGIKFMGAFSKIGLAPDAGSTYIFSRALGYQKTMEFFLLGTPLTSEELFACGIVNKLSEDVLTLALEYASRLNKLSPLTSEMIKKNIKSSLDSSFNESMERETYTQRFLGNSSDYKEGLTAFLAKREPNFTGQ
ncbi:MAG: enoyl-CoA hydratase/isomerase family protein [Bacteriovorax sp.]|nr:enoyl-CoA hydratase/isomerase family protein [Bacteriovorax sp.]